MIDFAKLILERLLSFVLLILFHSGVLVTVIEWAQWSSGRVSDS